jgi:hypothetical protein
MTPEYQIPYLGYQIDVAEEKMRFTARISRDGGLVSHDGRHSEVWASASCGSYDRAVLVAKKAIDTGLVE